MNVTILTPTYNRAELLCKCFDSLKQQTCFKFDWLIVDDGSIDNTSEVVDLFIASKPQFEITYIKKENGGKHTALNYSHKYIKGEYVLVLDSDDTLTPDAIECVLDKWSQYRDNPRIWNVAFQRGTDVNSPICHHKSSDDIVSNRIDYRINQQVVGDLCEVLRTDLFCEFNYPEFDGEKFIGEDCLWIDYAYKYDTVYVSKVIYIGEYLEGGLTQSGRYMRIKNPKGGMFRCNKFLTKNIIFKERIKKAILYDCYAIADRSTFSSLRLSNMPVLCFCMLPIGLFFYIKWSCQG